MPGVWRPDGSGRINTVFKPDDGSAAIGINYRFHAFAHWEIVPLAGRRSAAQWLSITAEEPQFFARQGYVRVYVDGLLVGEIRARRKDGTGFSAEPGQEPIFVPPEGTVGYRFRLANGRCSAARCRISIEGFWTFWHIFRFSITGENARFRTTPP